MGLSFSLFKSKSIWGVLLALLAWLSSPDVLAVLPDVVASIVQAIGALLAAIGFRNAVAVNGVASTPDRAIEANGANP